MSKSKTYNAGEGVGVATWLPVAGHKEGYVGVHNRDARKSAWKGWTDGAEA